VFHAPARIDFMAYIELNPHLHAGDSVPVEFFSNTNRLGSGTAVWHDVIRPESRPGQATPMWVMAAGFYPAEFSWNKVPPGVYSVTAKATWTNGLSAVSAPLKVTVLP
jgi:hypothetical protein